MPLPTLVRQFPLGPRAVVVQDVRIAQLVLTAQSIVELQIVVRDVQGQLLPMTGIVDVAYQIDRLSGGLSGVENTMARLRSS